MRRSSSSLIPFPFLVVILVTLFLATSSDVTEKVGVVAVNDVTFTDVALNRSDKELTYRRDSTSVRVSHHGPKLYAKEAGSSTIRDPTAAEVELWKKYYGDPEKLQGSQQNSGSSRAP